MFILIFYDSERYIYTNFGEALFAEQIFISDSLRYREITGIQISF